LLLFLAQCDEVKRPNCASSGDRVTETDQTEEAQRVEAHIIGPNYRRRVAAVDGCFVCVLSLSFA
jgi:hypothetical protein